MVDIISAIIVNVLIALYQPFGFSILMSVLAMYFYLFASDKEAAGQGTKKSIYIFGFRTFVHQRDSVNFFSCIL